MLNRNLLVLMHHQDAGTKGIGAQDTDPHHLDSTAQDGLDFTAQDAEPLANTAGEFVVSCYNESLQLSLVSQTMLTSL